MFLREPVQTIEQILVLPPVIEPITFRYLKAVAMS